MQTKTKRKLQKSSKGFHIASYQADPYLLGTNFVTLVGHTQLRVHRTAVFGLFHMQS